MKLGINRSVACVLTKAFTLWQTRQALYEERHNCEWRPSVIEGLEEYNDDNNVENLWIQNVCHPRPWEIQHQRQDENMMKIGWRHSCCNQLSYLHCNSFLALPTLLSCLVCIRIHMWIQLGVIKAHASTFKTVRTGFCFHQHRRRLIEHWEHFCIIWIEKSDV